MFLILTLIILVAAFNIVSSMIMLVKQKGQAIAILCTMGATRGNIMRLFFMTGATIGVAGTVFGVLLGLGVAHNIDGLKRWVEGLFGRRAVSGNGLFPVAPALQGRAAGSRPDRGDGAGPDLPGDDLSGLAGVAARSGRGAAQ